MKKKYYIYLILTWLLFILSIIYMKYNYTTLKNDNIDLKNEKQYFLDKQPTNINNTTITNSNKF